jgi:hypothetical protein
MEFSEISENLTEVDENILLSTGLEDALIGYVQRFGQPPVALYDQNKCIEIFMSKGMTEEEAWEHYEFNVIGSWVGDYTPAYAILTKNVK